MKTVGLQNTKLHTLWTELVGNMLKMTKSLVGILIKTPKS